MRDVLIVYGIPLELLMRNERERGNLIPSIVTEAVARLRETHAYKNEGLLRISGSATKIMNFVNAVNQGGEIDFTGLDSNVISGLLKLFFRRLPEPLMTYEHFPAFQATQGKSRHLRLKH